MAERGGQPEQIVEIAVHAVAAAEVLADVLGRRRVLHDLHGNDIADLPDAMVAEQLEPGTLHVALVDRAVGDRRFGRLVARKMREIGQHPAVIRRRMRTAGHPSTQYQQDCRRRHPGACRHELAWVK
jgi:hypothetical protein